MKVRLFSLRSSTYVVYFLVKGKVGYVIPRLKNKVYKEIREGETFGLVDFAEYFIKNENRGN
jgi:hypothetical protein